MTNHPQRSRARQARILRECERWMPILKPLSAYEAAQRILYGAYLEPSAVRFPFPDKDIESLAGALLAVAALAQPDDGWQPIETAPRGLALFYFPAIEDDRYGHGGLAEMICVDYRSSFPNRKPTHWRPLPDPPEPAVISPQEKERNDA